MTPPDQHRSRSRNRVPAGHKPSQHGGGRTGGSGSALVKHARYLELAQLARTAGDEVAAQHNLQHAEHWYRTAMAERRTGSDAPAAVDGGILAD